MRPSVGIRPPCVACGHVKRCSAYVPIASMHLAEPFENDSPIRHQRSLHTDRNRHLRRKASWMARGSTHCPSLITSNRAQSAPEFLDIGWPRRVRCLLGRAFRYICSLHTHRNRHLRRKASYMARGSTHCPSLTTSNRAQSSPEFLDIGRPRRVRCLLRHAFRYIFPPHGGLRRAPKSLR